MSMLVTMAVVMRKKRLVGIVLMAMVVVVR
jgi:hypothetical protein